MNAFWTTVASLGLSTIITAVIALIGTSKTLKRNQPVTNATAEEKQALANQANVATARGLITDLRDELDRQVKRAERMEARMIALETKLDAAEEQAELSAQQLVEVQEQNRQLRLQNRQLDEQIRLLTEELLTAKRID